MREPKRSSLNLAGTRTLAAKQITKDQPAADEIEISIFGPGLGEAIAVHLSGGRWILVDSCLDHFIGRSAPLIYFDAIGVRPNAAVDLVLATHWHDDHVSGIDQLVRECPAAHFFCSGALRCTEFVELLELPVAVQGLHFTRGTAYIKKVYEEIGDRFNFAYASSRILQRSVTANGATVSIEGWALSPSQAEQILATRNLGALVESLIGTAGIVPDRNPNHASVALALLIGKDQILLGADLEETGDPLHGWSAVIASSTRPRPFAGTAFKVSHHGSKTGDHPGVWSQLLVPKPPACLSPYSKGGRVLPTASDVQRIYTATDAAYITRERPFRRPTSRRSSAAALKSLRRMVSPGHVRMRKKLDASSWDVRLFDEAVELRQFKTT